MKYLRSIVLILPLIALTWGCNEGSNTIFEVIINDTQISNLNQLGNTSNVPSMTKIGSYYFATVGSIRRRLDTNTTWSSFSMGSGIHNTVATDGTNLYGGVIFNDGKGGLYQCTDPTNTLATPTSTPITLTDMKYIAKIKNFGATVFASFNKLSDGTFSMCSISGGTATEMVGTNVPDPINDFAFDGANLYYVSGSHVYRNSTDITPSAIHLYTGITYDPIDSRLMVSTIDGFIFRSADAVGGGLAGNQSSQQTYTRGTVSSAVPFTQIISLGSSLYLVGSQGAGFWTIDGSTTTVTVARWTGTSYSELYNGAVESIFVDGSQFFFCTTGAGLWNNSVTVSANPSPPPTNIINYGSTWTRE